MEEEGDWVEVSEVEEGQNGKKHGVEKKEEDGLPLIEAVDGVDLGPVSACSCSRFPHFLSKSAIN